MTGVQTCALPILDLNHLVRENADLFRSAVARNVTAIEGAAGFIQKPYGLDQLKATILGVLGPSELKTGDTRS